MSIKEGQTNIISLWHQGKMGANFIQCSSRLISQLSIKLPFALLFSFPRSKTLLSSQTCPLVSRICFLYEFLWFLCCGFGASQHVFLVGTTALGCLWLIDVVRVIRKGFVKVELEIYKQRYTLHTLTIVSCPALFTYLWYLPPGFWRAGSLI